MLSCPFSFATSRGVRPSLSIGPLSETFSSRRRHKCIWPSRAAQWKVVSPSLSTGLLSETLSSRRQQISNWPPSAASWRGVCPFLSIGLLYCTLSISRRHSSKCPSHAGVMKGRLPIDIYRAIVFSFVIFIFLDSAREGQLATKVVFLSTQWLNDEHITTVMQSGSSSWRPSKMRRCSPRFWMAFISPIWMIRVLGLSWNMKQ